MRLVDIEDVNAVLANTDELSAYAFKVLDEKISKIEIRAVIRDCDGCMGGAFNDCVECEKFKIPKEDRSMTKIISWSEFKSQNKNHNSCAELTNIACPVCGKRLYKDTHVALCTYPIQYRYFCDYCGWEGHA